MFEKKNRKRRPPRKSVLAFLLHLKGQVLGEAYRVLKPGGLFAVSDVVSQGEMPDEPRKSMESWVGCVAGALKEREYRQLLTDAGFHQADLEVTRVYDTASSHRVPGVAETHPPSARTRRTALSASLSEHGSPPDLEARSRPGSSRRAAVLK